MVNPVRSDWLAFFNTVLSEQLSDLVIYVESKEKATLVSCSVKHETSLRAFSLPCQGVVDLWPDWHYDVRACFQAP
jgi:hypothetical protein